MSDYDAFRKIINHEANQDDDGGFIAKLYGFQPEHDDEGPTARGLFQHMHRDTGGKLPTGPTEADYQQAWDNIRAAAKPAIERTLKVWVNMRHDRKLMDTIAQLQAIDQDNRYWHDHQGQPRRNPTMRPLLHNGKAPR